METALVRLALRVWSVLVLAFLFAPVALIVIYAFNRSTIESWPLSHLSMKWFLVAWHDALVRQAFFLSVRAAALATLIALDLGSCAAFAVHRFRFFGREGICFHLVLLAHER